tara:strand:+ start:109 stop:1389 length:1281 start_codon:yes stop_codon:yes gene_type:complete
MSFMVVNTGRVASQYFYINLNLQPNILMPSRYQFDYITKSFIKRRYHYPLNKLVKIKKNELSKRPGLCFGIVFHSARRNLVYPLNSQKNVDFLKILRDDLALNTIFFPVRDPNKVFKSEMNRQLARIVGDWSFPLGLNGWQKRWRLNQCEELKKQDLNHDRLAGFLPQKIDHKILKDTSKKFIINTAKIFSLYNLFDKIYDNVKVFEFEHLFNHPENIFKSMAEEKGFSFTDLSLINAKLNSLPNRFLLYNNFTLEVDSETQKCWNGMGISKKIKFGFKQKSALKRLLIDKQNPFVRSCRMKFEIPEVMSVCEDWGKYEQVGLVPERAMPMTYDAVNAKIAIGMHCDDVPIFTAHEIEDMIKTIHSVICPRFDKNFKILFDYYRNHVYLKKIPSGDLYNVFKKQNYQEFLDFDSILKSPEKILKLF